MIRSRPKPKVQRGPALDRLSDDRLDKFIAAMSVGESRDSAEFARAPDYYTAVAAWFGRLSLDQVELVDTCG